jgi:CheY-like chemotaxis protein
VIAEVIELLGPRAAAKQLRLAAAVDISVPPRIVGDPTRIRQILVNLVGNAVKFTDRGEVLLRAHPRARTSAAMELELSVSDTGIGIPSDRLSRLFHPFSQVDASTTRRFGGTGLGLAICKRLAELMGGSISARSTADAGSTFTLLLPVELADAEPAAATPQPELPASRATLRILLAEDNSVNQQVALRMLRSLGYSAELASDGREALEACLARPFDLVLMDVQMPELDGLETTRRLRAELPPEQQPYVIAMTANALAGDRDDCLAAGMDDYLSKPVQRADLAAALRRVPPPDMLARTIDQPTLQRLRIDFGPSFAEDLVALIGAYRGQLQADLQSMHAALEQGDRGKIVALAHRLKGASLTLGACHAATLSRRLERCEGEAVETIRDLLLALEQAGERAARALERLAAEG